MIKVSYPAPKFVSPLQVLKLRVQHDWNAQISSSTDRHLNANRSTHSDRIPGNERLKLRAGMYDQVASPTDRIANCFSNRMRCFHRALTRACECSQQASRNNLWMVICTKFCKRRLQVYLMKNLARLREALSSSLTMLIFQLDHLSKL